MQVIAADLDQAQSVADFLQKMLDDRENQLHTELHQTDMNNQMISRCHTCFNSDHRGQSSFTICHTPLSTCLVGVWQNVKLYWPRDSDPLKPHICLVNFIFTGDT